MHIHEVTIVGAGPAGLFTTFYAGLRSLDVHLIESLDELGGQPNHLYPEKNIYDIPGHPVIKGSELINQLTEQMQRYQPKITLGEQVLTVTPILQDNQLSYYEIETQKNTYYSRTVIVAAGNGAFTPRKLTTQSLTPEFESHIHYFIKDLQHFSGKNVAIFGGGDSAVDWALELSKVAKSVAIVHRRDQFRALESNVNAMEKRGVQIHTSSQLKSIQGTERIESLTLDQIQSKEVLTLPIDEIVVAYGYSMNLGPIKKWGFDFKRNAIEVNPFLETNLPGIYAVGDIATYSEKIKLIAISFSEGIKAINHIVTQLYPSDQSHSIHITHQ